jgi:hypothetical protein
MRTAACHTRQLVTTDHERMHLSAQIERLVLLLHAWRRELLQDIERAEARGLRQLAFDLRALARHVDAVLEAAHAGA